MNRLKNKVLASACTVLTAYILGRIIGHNKGYDKGKKKGEIMLMQAEAIQRYNAEFVEEQYEIINAKIREINEFYED